MSADTKKLKRYEIWSEVCNIADNLQRLTDEWWDIDDEVQELHYDRCNLGQLVLQEPVMPRKPTSKRGR